MENLIFSLNATMPIFLMMVIGYYLRHIGLFDKAFTSKMNQFVFKVGLPILVFKELSTADFYEMWDTQFVVFCFVVSLLSILASVGLSFLVKDRSVRGEFAQASYRSSSALLGCAFVQNIYGSAGTASLMIIAAVPLYNVAAVLILNLMKPDRGQLNKYILRKTFKDVITNPIIIGIAIGMGWSLLEIPQPSIMEKTVVNIANLATPLGLMALGAEFDMKQAKHNLGLAIICSVLKLVVFTGIFLPIAVHLGFYEQKLVAILVMLGAATTVSCFVMARNLGHKGELTSTTVVITTLASAFTLTFWLFILKSLGLIYGTF
ncbi:MAG: AEC family transporter [Cellulosilyticum sp.]|nr:AEC family transporter [Cellulosilyticum sp.]